MSYVVKHNNKIIETTDDSLSPLQYASLIYPNATYISLVVDENKLMDDSFNEGMYIISDVKTTKIVNKKKKTIYGFIYNSYVYEIKVIDIIHLLINYKKIKMYDSLYCIGHYYDEVEKLINNSIIDKNVREENVYIISSNNINSWTTKYPVSFVYDVLDEEVLHAIIPDFDTNNDKRLIVFDDCLTSNIIKNKKFIELLDNHVKQKISIITITKDNDINEISSNFIHIMS